MVSNSIASSSRTECGDPTLAVGEMEWGGARAADPIAVYGRYSQERNRAARIAKRAIDVVGASIGLILSIPVFVVAALAIKIDSHGPIIYRSARVGKGGRVFTCFKLRSMVDNAHVLLESLQHLNDREGLLFKATNDPRITRVGMLLRKYSVDEIPQFWNVLAGDMSLVGPRPATVNEVQQYDSSCYRRLSVQPGITGLWQVSARRSPSFSAYISNDLEYIDNWSIWMDIKIILRTFSAVLAGTGQ